MKTVIEMAREATNGRIAKNEAETESLIGLDEVTRFAELVRADEREACAMWAWSAVLSMTNSDTADKVLASIRARSNT